MHEGFAMPYLWHRACITVCVATLTSDAVTAAWMCVIIQISQVGHGLHVNTQPGMCIALYSRPCASQQPLSH